MSAYIITIPGKFMDTLRASGVYEGNEVDLADPAGRELHDALHGAVGVKRGRGYSYTVTLTSTDAVGWLCEYAEMASYCNRHTDVEGNDPAETRAADKVAAQCREVLA